MRRTLRRRILQTLATVLATVVAVPFVVTASEEQSAVQQAISATATFAPRTSLQVSSQVLQFHVTEGSIAAEATVEFAAGARTRNGGDVLLVVQAQPLPPGGALGALTMATGTEGTIAASVVQDVPTVVARWVGAGLRTGRVTFRLQAAPGRYEIPVRFLLNLN